MNRVLRGIGIFFGFLFTGVLMFAVFLVFVIVVLMHGPSENAKFIFTRSLNETSALKFLPYWFLDDDEVEEILADVPETDDFVPLAYDTVSFTAAAADAGDGSAEAAAGGETVVPDQADIEIVDIKGGTYVGKLMIVADPKRVVVGTLSSYGAGLAGKFLYQFIEDYNAVGGTNAGGFEDPDGHGAGGCPLGIVIENGAIRYGGADGYYQNVLGIDGDGWLHVGNMTGAQALGMGIVTACSFPIGSILIQDGVANENLNSGINPRTVLGQRGDGAMLLMVIEGRHAGSLGASAADLLEIMQKYGAINASMLDGGTSSIMYYNGEQITRGSNIIGMRRLPTAILVLPE